MKRTNLLVLGLVFGSTSLSLAQSVHLDNVDQGKIHNGKVHYFSARAIKKFPLPLIIFQRTAYTKKLRDEAYRKLVYPIINTSSKAIAVILIDFSPKESEKGLSVDVYWQNGETISGLVEYDQAGHIDAEGYKLVNVPKK